MNGVLGSLKNMLKRWRLNFRNKKKKEELEIYNRKITKYPRLTSFIYSTIAIIYSPFGYAFSKSNKKASIEQPKLYKKIEHINIELDKIIEKKGKNIKSVEDKIIKVKKALDIPMSKESKNYFESKLKEIEIKKEYIKNPNKKNKVRTKIIERPLEKAKTKSLPKKNIKANDTTTKSLQNFSTLIITNKVMTQEDNKLEQKFIKEANNKLKEFDEQIKNIENKIVNTNQYNHFYDLENELKYLRKKIEKLKEKYDEIKDYLDFKIECDKYELCKSPKKIDEMLEKIEKNLKSIEIKKKELLNKKENNKNEEKKEKKETKRQEEKKEEKKQETDDIIKAQQLILNNIINQNKYFDDYMKKIEKSSNKKRTIISSLSNLSKVILNFTISLLPISLFKNKLFGTLVSSIMINNSLKTMRRMLNPSLKIDYELFLDHYYNSKNILYDTYQMCNNSLQELTLLKEELLVFDQNDIKQLLIEINLIENNIKKQIKSLNIKKDNLEKIYIKVKKDNYRF